MASRKVKVGKAVHSVHLTVVTVPILPPLLIILHFMKKIKGCYKSLKPFPVEGIDPYGFAHWFVHSRRDPRASEFAILDRPASPAYRLFRSGHAKGSGAIKTLVKPSSGSEFPVNLFHLLPSLQVSEPISFVLDGVMVEEGFRRDN
jgi:hypothetical protein